MPISEVLYNTAQELSTTLIPNLRTVTGADIIMPDDYNNCVNILTSYLNALNLVVPIRYTSVKQGDAVLFYHINDLKNACSTLWNYVYYNVGDPYSTDSDFLALKNVIDSIPTKSFLSPLTPDEWNAVFEFCIDFTNIVLRYQPRAVFVFSTDDWSSAEPYIISGSVVLINPTISTVTPDRILSILQSKRIKLMVLIDTQPYHYASVPALYGILYSTNYYSFISHPPSTSVAYPLVSDADKQYFNTDTLYGVFDYMVWRSDHVSQAVDWALNPNYPDFSFAFVTIGNSYVVEVPYDGMWFDDSWLELYLNWLPMGYPNTFNLNRVIHIAKDTTDSPDSHKYPTLSQTLKALGYPYYDMR